MIHYISIVDSNISLDIATEPQTVPIVEIIEAPQEDVIILPEASNEGFNKNEVPHRHSRESTAARSHRAKDRAEPAELIPIPTPIPIPIIHLTLLAPAPNRLPIQPPTPLPTPDFRPLRSPSEQTRSSPVSGPFAPLRANQASPNPPRIPLHPRNPVDTPTRSLATPPRGSSRADRRKYEHPLISLAAEDIPQVTGTIPGGSRLHQVVLLYIV
ncbi:hypothetical protein GEV33_001581 [Tenebrio molitor]|uniref:Uncharacterized protein n=1 Tax=Tenebrio molitor TaxID=7067 RepID=A0A8J6LGQ1_TENMO|nr:hypothetical protein GEV33_001581 [Tenebrio molitor]